MTFRRSRLSVRGRLMIAVGLIVAAALVGAGTALYIVESARINRQVTESIDREVATFRTFQKQKNDPSTDRPYTSVESLLESFLVTNLPAQDEVLWGYFPGPDSPEFSGTPDTALKHSTALASAVDRLQHRGGSADITVHGHHVSVTVVPLKAGSTSGAFVVTHDITATRSALRDLMRSYILIAAISLLVIVGFASLIVARLLLPVRRLRETAQDISAGSLGSRLEISGSDDLVDLQLAFNAMLDRLQATFDAQRRMLDDAGHELRTPLTVLRGHLEVLDPDDPEDVNGTRDLLIDETERMSRLVSDLLVLAKSGRPDFIVVSETDVGDLTRGVVERSRGLSARFWKVGQVADGVARLDRDRITQALLQLADNAIRFTEIGGTIEIGSRFVGEHVEFWVHDDGPGVDPKIRESIFARFTSGGDTHEGFGLGLSIVQAIADAHHGSIVLAETTRGARFVLRVPRGVV